MKLWENAFPTEFWIEEVPDGHGHVVPASLGNRCHHYIETHGTHRHQNFIAAVSLKNIVYYYYLKRDPILQFTLYNPNSTVAEVQQSTGYILTN